MMGRLAQGTCAAKRKRGIDTNAESLGFKRANSEHAAVLGCAVEAKTEAETARQTTMKGLEATKGRLHEAQFPVSHFF